jgi:hypothetical protein
MLLTVYYGPPTHSYVEIVIPDEMVLGMGGAFGGDYAGRVETSQWINVLKGPQRALFIL